MSYLFKQAVIFLVILLFAVSVVAVIKVVEPKQSDVLNEATLTLGEVQPGETFKLVIARGLGRTKWTNIEIQSSSLPTGWSIEKQVQDQSFILLVTVPDTAANDSYNLSIVLSKELGTESFNALVLVKSDLLSISMNDLLQTTLVGNDAVFKLTVRNTSMAPHTVRITTDLPEYWFSPRELTIQPGELKNVDLILGAKVYGIRDFTFTVDSVLNSTRKEFPARLTINPTLIGKFSAVFNGFPFFSMSMLPYYVVDGFLSLLQ